MKNIGFAICAGCLVFALGGADLLPENSEESLQEKGPPRYSRGWVWKDEPDPSTSPQPTRPKQGWGWEAVIPHPTKPPALPKGWGWERPTTRPTQPPANMKGWGWERPTPPPTEPPSTTKGWGWQRPTSPPTERPTSTKGWGWQRPTSPPTERPTTEKGWGWERPTQPPTEPPASQKGWGPGPRKAIVPEQSSLEDRWEWTGEQQSSIPSSWDWEEGPAEYSVPEHPLRRSWYQRPGDDPDISVKRWDAPVTTESAAPLHLGWGWDPTPEPPIDPPFPPDVGCGWEGQHWSCGRDPIVRVWRLQKNNS